MNEMTLPSSAPPLSARRLDSEKFVGLRSDGAPVALDPVSLRTSIAITLAAQGIAMSSQADNGFVDRAAELFQRYAEQARLLRDHLCPADRRLQDFLDTYAARLKLPSVALPRGTVLVDRYGLARELSLPEARDEYRNSEVSSFRIDNGVLHNPTNDKRTTQGVFHIADVGLPVPADKVAVPLPVYWKLLEAAFDPPADLAELPFTAHSAAPARTFVSLLLRPLVCPEVPGVRAEKTMEIRFFAPGGLVSNLDFVESIFGNAGDPSLPENDAALDTEHWTGHSGAVVLAPHLRKLRKVDLGVPHISEATQRQKAQGVCWSDENELYNGGKPFKITLRDERGIMVTILADNYFGYCKKEVKTQISLSANLSGLAEEEHSGGALAFASYALGSHFSADPRIVGSEHSMQEALELLGDAVIVRDDGYATDKRYPNIHVLPEDMELDLNRREARFTHKGRMTSVKLLRGHYYLHPSGYKVRVDKHPLSSSFRLIGTSAEGTFCHKPCTVSGGGKSEISKSLNDAVLQGPIYIGNFEADLDWAARIIERDYTNALRPELREVSQNSGRPLLAASRSLGSVIKLLTPNAELYTAEHNAFLESIPSHVRAIVFAIKRSCADEETQAFKKVGSEDAVAGSDTDHAASWKTHLTVDVVNGAPGHELKWKGQRLQGFYLRVGRSPDGAWRTYKLRQDFVPADKVQTEDDITVSTIVPRSQLKGLPSQYQRHHSLKLVSNCEYRLFQRPDDAVIPGYDKQTELDMSSEGLFSSNFEPLDASQLKQLTEDFARFDAFSEPMQRHLSIGSASEFHNVCSAEPRLVNGKPTKNPRYLQVRPDLSKPVERYIAELGARLHRRVPKSDPVVFPVQSVLSGRRNNPPDLVDGKPIRPLCVYGPIHYQELPELFMDYICSVTGKSPSTTGAGSEGALTKGPFNAICATADLNNALVGALLTGYGGFSSAAGYIGPEFRVDHDISLLIPEIWCRLTASERDPQTLIARGHLEKVEDFDFEGRRVEASRLGFRITERFVHHYLGRLFDNPIDVFPLEMLKPELQDRAVFVDGVENLVQAQRAAALDYFADGSIHDACPPLRALLHIMATGTFEGKTIDDPVIRALFTREALLASDWYRARLVLQRERDIALSQRHVAALSDFMSRPGYGSEAERFHVPLRLERARRQLMRVSSASYLDELEGTIGADPIHNWHAPC